LPGCSPALEIVGNHLLLGRPEGFQHVLFEDFDLLLCVLKRGLA
jgi:hypothetical protein